MKTPYTLFALTASALAVLGACGGGGSSDTTAGTAVGNTTGTASAQSVAVQTYITDNLATEYSKVWVTIKKITVLDGAGAEVTLLDATAAPVVVNLSSLASVGQFMSTVTIPAGIYTQINVTLDNSVQLVSLDGATTTDARFAATGSDFVWKVRNVEIDASNSGQIVLDFNLAKFTYSVATNLVTPNMDLPRPDDAFHKFTRQVCEVHGTVKSVDATAGTITVDDPRLGNGVVVTLAADAVLIGGPGHTTQTLADLKVGDRIEIKGKVTPGATTADPLTVLATSIHVEAAASAPAPKARGAGKVTAVSGTLVTVSISEANFLPGSNSVVVDIAAARFAHGQVSDIAVGATVEFRGTVSGTGAAARVTATTMDVDGAPSQSHRDRHPAEHFSGLVGSVAALNTDGSFTVTVASGGVFAAAGTYTVDPSHAYYREGTAACLAVGVHVEALGTLTGSTLAATVLELDGTGCGDQPHSRPAPGRH